MYSSLIELLKALRLGGFWGWTDLSFDLGLRVGWFMSLGKPFKT